MSNVKISALTQGVPAETDVVPYVDLATNTTKKALKSELKGIQGNAATVDAGTTTTLAAGQNATVTNVGTTSAAIFNFAIPQGIQGLTGADGACVVSVSFVGNDMVFVLDDASTVTLTNAKTDLKGDTGAKIISGAFVGNDLVFTLDDASTATILNAKVDLKGEQGIQGIVGNDGLDITWLGAYSGATSYVINDAVSYNGSSYICKLASTGNLPTNTTYFDLMAQKGTDGAGSGDVIAPATNSDSYIPQWDGINSKTLKNGIPTSTFAPALGADDNYVTDAEKIVIGNTSGINTGDEVIATGAEVDTGTDNNKMVTPKAMEDSSYAKTTAIPVKATGAEIDTGTDDAKFATPKAIADSKLSYTDGTETLTNKRINPRLVTSASYTTDTGTSLSVATCDQFEVTAQAGALKFNNPGGTPLGGQKLIIRIKDNGTARALTYDTQFRAMGNALPTTTVVNKTLYMGFIWNATDSKFDLVAVAQEA